MSVSNSLWRVILGKMPEVPVDTLYGNSVQPRLLEELLATDKDIVIEYCPVDRIHELQTFINDHWRQGHILSRDSVLLRWQYNYPQDASRLSVLTAREDDALAGILGIIPFRFCHRGKSVPACWLAMWKASSLQRSRMTGLRLFQRVLAGDYQVVGALGINEKTYGVYDAFRFDSRKSIPRWVRLGSQEHVEKLLGKDVSLHYSDISTDDPEADNQSTSESTFGLLEWNAENASRWDSAWSKHFAPRLLGTWRDAAYLRWRYVDHPSFPYVLRFAEDPVNGELAGLLVYRVETVRDRKEKILRILEFLSAGQAGKALARATVEVSEAEDVAFSDFYCTSRNFAAPLEAAGFVPQDRLGLLIPSRFQPLDWETMTLNGSFWVDPEVAEDNHSFFQTSALYVTRADGDQDRPN